MAAAMNFFSYWFSDKIVLRMYSAQEVSPQEAPELYAMVDDLARQAEVPMPKVYIIPDESPNAFATGRNPEHAVVAVTQGILRLLTPTELKGVLAHEMGHVRNRDILIQSIAATLGGAIMVLADMARFSASSSRFSPPLPPCLSRWPFPAPGSILPMKPAPVCAITRTPWPTPWKN
jgi:heat shock protein HtpX